MRYQDVYGARFNRYPESVAGIQHHVIATEVVKAISLPPSPISPNRSLQLADLREVGLCHQAILIDFD